jgi:hypothetical protein
MATDPYAEFGGSVATQTDTKSASKSAPDPYAEFGGQMAQSRHHAKLSESLPSGTPQFIKSGTDFIEQASTEGQRDLAHLASFIPGKIGKMADDYSKSDYLPTPETDAEKRGSMTMHGLEYVMPTPAGKVSGLAKGVEETRALRAAVRAASFKAGAGMGKNVSIGKGLGEIAKIGAAHAGAGAVRFGSVEAAQTGSGKDAALAAATGATLEGGLGVASSLRGPVAEWLRNSGRDQYAKALRPRGVKVQEKVAKKLLSGANDDIVGRGIVFGSAKDLEAQALEKHQQLGKELDGAYSKLDEKAKFKLKPVYDDLWKFATENGLYKDGTVKEQKAITATLEQMKEIAEKLGPEIGEASPSKIRDIRDLLTERAKLYKTNAAGVSVKGPEVDGYTKKLAETASKGLRSVLNDSSPTLKKLNREFEFWKTLHESLGARDKQLLGQMRFASRMFSTGKTIGGGLVGGAYGKHKDGITGAFEYGLIGAAGGVALSTALEHPLFNTVSAVVKDRIANLLVSGEGAKGTALLLAQLASKTGNPKQKGVMIAMSKKVVAQQEMQKAAEAYVAKQNAAAAAAKTATEKAAKTAAAQQAQKVVQTQVQAQLQAMQDLVTEMKGVKQGQTDLLTFQKDQVTAAEKAKADEAAAKLAKKKPTKKQLAEQAAQEAQATPPAQMPVDAPPATSTNSYLDQYSDPKHPTSDLFTDKKTGKILATENGFHAKAKYNYQFDNYTFDGEHYQSHDDYLKKKLGSSSASAVESTPTPTPKAPESHTPSSFVKSQTQAASTAGGAQAGSAEFKKQAKEGYKLSTAAEAKAKHEAIVAEITNQDPKPFNITKHSAIEPHEAEAISSYKGSGYSTLNSYLYENGGKVAAHHAAKVKAIDSAIQKHTLNEDQVLYRGIKGSIADKLKALGPGDSWTAHGFNSTSSGFQTPNSFAGNNGVILRIEAKAGQKAYPFGFADYEKEILLPRGVNFKVTHKAVVNGRTILTVNIQ